MTPILLFAKCTLVLLIAAIVSAALRRHSAATRHLIWLTAIVTTLLLPLAALLPNAALQIPMTITTTALGLQSLPSPPSPSVLRWIGAIWILGTFVFLVRLLIGTCSAVAMIRRAQIVAQDDQGNEIRATPGLDSPIAWGIGRKLTLLPQSALLDWNHDRRRAILLHETSHLRRHDCWALLIAEMACALYWYNPLVWFAASQMRREQEHAADDEVLNSGVDPAEYADHLVAIARAARPPVLAAGAIHRSNLSTRVEAILDQRRNRTMATRRLMLASIATLFVIALPLASMQTQKKIYKIGDAGVIAPRLIEKQEPQYTPEAKDAKLEGSVTLSAVIDVDGHAHDIKIEKSLDEGLDANAITAIETWRFEPAQKDGEPVPVSVKIEVNFRLL